MQHQSPYLSRRQELVKKIKNQFSNSAEGVILLSAGFEQDHNSFRQESSFYYYTGITEPGLFLLMDLSGKTILYVPRYNKRRAQWVIGTITPENIPQQSGIQQVIYAGQEISGFNVSQLFHFDDVSALIKELEALKNKKTTFFTLKPETNKSYIQQQITLDRLSTMVPGLKECCIDISSIVASMRRSKSKEEIDLLYKSVEYTMVAHSGVSQLIEDGKKESEIQATVEYLFTEAQGRPAFPSIIASGKNGNILHYTHNSGKLKNGELVVVDIGIDLNYYCADLSRTYPVSGQFTKKQKELYNIVLSTQEYIAGLALPGYWLNNKDNPEKSLHHLAVQFLADKGYDTYFVHTIGHFLGLDVHDVGDQTQALMVGDVITIEPGLYIPHENSGIRIEDDYLMTKEGLVCISQDLPREVEEIEEMMQEAYDDQDEEYEE